MNDVDVVRHLMVGNSMNDWCLGIELQRLYPQIADRILKGMEDAVPDEMEHIWIRCVYTREQLIEAVVRMFEPA